LCQFLGLTSYYRRFIERFSKIASPLHHLTKRVEWNWTNECQQAFELLKEKLISAPVMSYPNFDLDFMLETDASIKGLGAVLSQRKPGSACHPIAYASRSLSNPERHYSITELETLAVVWAIQHFRTYLYGHDVTVITDHSAVRAILDNPESNGKHARWWLKVFGSGINHLKVIHRPGRENTAADALSRNPLAGLSSTTEVDAMVSKVYSTQSTGDITSAPRPSIEMTEGNFHVEQRKDPKLKVLINYLEEEKLPSNDFDARKAAAQARNFTLIDKILSLLDGRPRNRRRAVVPCHLRS